jgi:hypothetical protein
MSELQWMTTHAVPERDAEWWEWLAQNPAFRPPVAEYVSQEFGARRRRLKIDPLSCAHEIGRGMANRLRGGKNKGPLWVNAPVVCRICKATLKPSDLDNEFLDPSMYIATRDNFADPEGDDSEIVRKWQTNPHQPSRVGRPVHLGIQVTDSRGDRIHQVWAMPIVDKDDLRAYGETTQEFLASVTVGFNETRLEPSLKRGCDCGPKCKYPISHSLPTVRTITAATISPRRDDEPSRRAKHHAPIFAWYGEQLSRWSLVVALSDYFPYIEVVGGWVVSKDFGWEVIVAPSPKRAVVLCADREGQCRHIRCKIWRERFRWRKGYAVSKRPAVEIAIRQLRAAGDVISAMRLMQTLTRDGWRPKYTVAEIADTTGVAMRTIERWLRDSGITVLRTVLRAESAATNDNECGVSI